MSRLYGVNSIFTDYNDSGHITPIIKPYGLKEWAHNMETSNNQHEDRLTELSGALLHLQKKVNDLDSFVLFVASNYPHIVQEYITAERAKARMEVSL